jgi:ATP synthase protein I
VAFGFAGGAAGAVSAALAGILTIAFFTIGQAVQVLVADADPRTVLFASLVSYIARVGGLGALLAVALANADRFTAMNTTAVAVTTIAVVLGWLATEIWVFSRLRLPVFDETERTSEPTG